EGFITGLHKSPFHGFSVEFADYRQYNPGESTRFIDWKLYGRTEKLFVKRFEEETNLRSRIIIDTSSSMLFPYKEKGIFNKLFYSVYCSAALIYLLRKQRDAVGLTLFSEKVDLHTAARLSSVHAQVLYNKLQELLNPDDDRLNRSTSAAENLHYIAENTHKRSLVILFSDMFEHEHREELFSALQHLRYRKHEVILFHVTDHTYEEEFRFASRPYKFIDMENRDELKLNPNELRDHYTKAITEYFDELKLKCGQFQIDFVEADIHKDFSQVLLAFLIKRKNLF
ncbi:MAG: DUF58 domain-containing protein, partial [Bacteroidota bacterium]